ncbi:MAG: response regulator transcription factor [Balneolaceae bacterium]
MEKQKILIVDDEHDLLDLIEYNIEQHGFEALRADNGKEGIALARNHYPDLIILDIMMPEMDGHEVCAILKEDKKLHSIPIIFLTARGDEKTEIKSLEKGADDYLTKPISPAKLMSRIKTVLRRVNESSDPGSVIHVKDLEINKERYLVLKGSKKYQLPRKEFDLLFFLASRKGKVLSRDTLLNEVWGSGVYVIDRTIDVHIRKIREKLGSDYIETVKGVGYRFKE